MGIKKIVNGKPLSKSEVNNIIRKANRDISKENEKYGDEFVRSEIPRKLQNREAPNNVYRNKYFLVQEYIYPLEGHIRLSICRTRLNKDGHWEDQISWDELFEIKNAVGYADFDAIEIYPRESDLVNVANLRHLWITKEPVALAWRNNNIDLVN